MAKAKVFVKIASHGYKEGFKEKLETLFQQDPRYVVYFIFGLHITKHYNLTYLTSEQEN